MENPRPERGGRGLIGSVQSPSGDTHRMTDLRTLADIRPTDIDAVGGKALSLAVLAAAGLPVPPGFCLTTAAHRRLRGQSLHAEAALVAAVAAAYRDLGAGPVAVRSSATAEDGSVSSFA